MRIALLTDLHANREAFDACLAHAAARGADKFAFTGDLVGYGGDPAFVLDTVMEYAARGAIVVKGNHDEAAAHAWGHGCGTCPACALRARGYQQYVARKAA